MDAILRLLLICLMAWLCECEPELTVCPPKLGCIKGKYMPGYDTEKFEAFLGIPYAEPPVKDLRFHSPKMAPKFSGTYDATNAKSDCIQKNYLLPGHAVSGAEDCLYLNVYRPVNSGSNLLPVMVYIYGGGWFSGSASPIIAGPEYFMDTQKVILVTFNYRLGPFGFLSTNDSQMSGNFGLKDQNLALRWVQSNIEYFGGNRKSVTLFGQSAGAISAHMHVLSKQSVSLFHRVLTLSGTANVPFAITDDPLTQTRNMAKYCNIKDYGTLTTKELLSALQKVDALTLLNAGDNLKYWDVDHMTNFRPVIEDVSVPDAFLIEHPAKTLADEEYVAVPWMASFVPHEGAVRVVALLENNELRSKFNADFNNLLEKLLDLPQYFSESQRSSSMSKIIKEYFNGTSNLNAANGQGLMDIVTDRGFAEPLYEALYEHVTIFDSPKFPVYLVKFNYRGANTFANLYAGRAPSRDYGVVHCDDLIYLFRANILFPDFPKNSTDARVMRALVSNYVSFATTGAPQDAKKVPRCTEKGYSLRGNTICSYQEFKNSGEGSFEIGISNTYNTKGIAMWRDILGKPNL